LAHKRSPPAVLPELAGEYTFPTQSDNGSATVWTSLFLQPAALGSDVVNDKRNLWLPLALMIGFALTRVPGVLPWNFSAAYALAFCAGVYLPRRMAWWLPLSVLLVTDVCLNLFVYAVHPVSGYMLVNYLGFAVLIALGQCFHARSSWLALLAAGLGGAILFYLITNTAAWLQNPQYAKTFLGWVQALTTGLPGFPPTWMFFRSTLLSSGLFTSLFVGAMKLSQALEPKEETDSEEAEEPEPEEAKA
jgi:hypothetical protein